MSRITHKKLRLGGKFCPFPPKSNGESLSEPLGDFRNQNLLCTRACFNEAFNSSPCIRAGEIYWDYYGQYRVV